MCQYYQVVQSLAEWRISNKTKRLQKFQENWGLEDIQENCQKNKTSFFQWQDSQNYVKKFKTLGPNKVGQQT